MHGSLHPNNNISRQDSTEDSNEVETQVNTNVYEASSSSVTTYMGKNGKTNP